MKLFIISVLYAYNTLVRGIFEEALLCQKGDMSL